MNSKPQQDELQKAKEEETHQAALNVIELYRANFELQRTLEENEVKYKREIRQAWTQPRPPPTTNEQRMDQLALEIIESKHIFDRIGDQQRPIRTDPQLVSLETQVNIMITRARINLLLEDYPKMYMHANHAAATASQVRFSPLTALCCYYRGVASYHYGDLDVAKDDFLESRGCAGRYGISSKSIEDYIHRIDNASREFAVNEQFPASSSSKGKQPMRTHGTDAGSKDELSPSSVDDATTLVGESPRSPEDTALPLSLFGSPDGEERDPRQSSEHAVFQTKTFRKPSPLGAFPLDGSHPQPSSTDVMPNYQPQEAAISEEIRKDILESKAHSLNPASDASPTEAATLEERSKLPPASLASTEWTLLGSTTSSWGTRRRVPRPYVAPITTSLATKTYHYVREASPEATPDSGYRDEMDEDEIMAAFNTQREDATPTTAEGPGMRYGMMGQDSP